MNLAKINEQHADTWLRILVMTTILQLFQYIPIVYSVPYCTSLLYSFIMKHSKDQLISKHFVGPQAQHPAPHLGQACHQFRPTCSWRRVQIPKIGWWFQCHFNVIWMSFLQSFWGASHWHWTSQLQKLCQKLPCTLNTSQIRSYDFNI